MYTVYIISMERCSFIRKSGAVSWERAHTIVPNQNLWGSGYTVLCRVFKREIRRRSFAIAGYNPAGRSLFWVRNIYYFMFGDFMVLLAFRHVVVGRWFREACIEMCFCTFRGRPTVGFAEEEEESSHGCDHLFFWIICKVGIYYT